MLIGFTVKQNPSLFEKGIAGRCVFWSRDNPRPIVIRPKSIWQLSSPYNTFNLRFVKPQLSCAANRLPISVASSLAIALIVLLYMSVKSWRESLPSKIQCNAFLDDQKTSFLISSACNPPNLQGKPACILSGGLPNTLLAKAWMSTFSLNCILNIPLRSPLIN